MTEAGGSISLVKRDDVAYLELQAPPHNILTCCLMGQMSAALDEIAKDSTLKAVALTATGKAFSAGADVGEHAPELSTTPRWPWSWCRCSWPMLSPR